MSRYEIFVTPQALAEIKDLPGYMRQRVKRAIEALADEPRPSETKILDVPLDADVFACRLRLDKWRVVYVISETEHIVDILAIRKRPPYDYGDLQDLLNELG